MLRIVEESADTCYRFRTPTLAFQRYCYRNDTRWFPSLRSPSICIVIATLMSVDNDKRIGSPSPTYNPITMYRRWNTPEGEGG